MNYRIVAIVILSLGISVLKAQETQIAGKQATPPPTQSFGKEAFCKIDFTEIRWLGNAGFLINSRGVNIMVDPLLLGFDMPLLIDMPIAAVDIPALDAVLVTHVDNDHYSIPTNRILSSVTKEFHSTNYVASLMKEEGFNAYGHNIGNEFHISDIRVKLTSADHAWQNMMPDRTRKYKMEDYCGFWIETPDGTIWAPGDSRLLDEHLQMPTADAIFFDFSDGDWHLGLDGAVKVANTYPDTPLLLCHWGSVDAPNMKEFNGNPDELIKRVINPERVYVLAPGEPFRLQTLINKKMKKNISGYSSIFPLEMKADSNFNTGVVYLSVLKGGEGSLIANFLFEPGSRNYWHSHPGTVQTLLVLDGEGYYQEEGKPRQIIRQGDVIVTPADVLHWNGATPGSRLSCMTVTEPSDGRHAIQVRAVTDEEYLIKSE